VATFTITSLGCKVNQYDGAAISAVLEAEGLSPAHGAEQERAAKLAVVNTCCVTAAAMRKSRQAIRRAVRRSPDAVVLVTGCYSDFDAAGVRAVVEGLNVPSDRAFVAGHHGDVRAAVAHAGQAARGSRSGRADAERDEEWMRPNALARPAAPDGLSDSIRTRRQAAVKADCSGTRTLPAIRHFAGHCRAFVKVQDGCDAFCTYCIVPYTRCRVWSRALDAVLSECRALVAAGHKELVLAGVFLGAYGRNTAVRKRWPDEPAKLPELIRRVAAIDGLFRLRLSSLEPGDLSDELLGVCRDTPNFAPHFHLPLQSGSPAVLRRMNRQYTVEQYERTIARLRDAFDRPAVSTDILVGFPGESEADFGATLAVARGAGFTKIHAFPFSAMPGTAAWQFRHEAPPTAVIRERMVRLAALERDLSRAFRRSLVGEGVDALVEASPKRGEGRAMTGRYQTAFFRDGAAEPRDIIRLLVTGVRDDGLVARPAANADPA